MRYLVFLCGLTSIMWASEHHLSEETFSYVEVGAFLSSTTKEGRPAPMVSGGVRYEKDFSAIDLGGTLAYFLHDNGKSVWGVYFPKIQFLEFSNHLPQASLFYGGGLSLGFVGNGTIEQKFFGMTVQGIVGYEWSRNLDFKKFISFEVYQPFLPFYKTGDWYYPSMGLSVGLSF